MEKIKSPKTGYMITVGGKTYNQLIKEGYISGKIKSPKTNRLINIKGKTYKDLYNQGYFNKITGLEELDQEILLHLPFHDLKPVNKYTEKLIDGPFWCKWLYKHYNIKSNQDCKIMSELLNKEPNMNNIYHIALTKGYLPLVTYLLEHKLVNALEYGIEHYSSLEPIQTAARYGHLDIIKLLLSYNADPISALYEAASYDIVKYLLEHYTYEQDYLDEYLQNVTRNGDLDIITLLIKYGADPSKAITSAIHSDNIDILKYILSFNPIIDNESIAIALGLRKYDMLRLLIDIDVENDQLEEAVLPYINDKALYYEVKYKWYNRDI